MNIRKCLAEAVKQQHISQEEADALGARFDEISKQVAGPAEAKAQLVKEMEAEAAERKRRSVISEAVRKNLVGVLDDYRNAKGEADLAEAFVRMHENFGRDGGSFIKDAESLRETIRRRAQEEMDAAVIEFRKGAITGDLRRSLNSSVALRADNVAREMHGEKTGDAKAATIASAFRKISDELRDRFNKAGGAIGKLENWFPHSHDMQALLDFGRDKWVTYMMADGILYRERMIHPLTKRAMSDAELKESLGVVWDRITSDGWVDREASGVPVGRGALWSQHADHRFLHFKNADAWLKYSKDFGNPDPFAAIVSHINTMSRDIAHMETFGPNPTVMRNYLKQHLTARAAMVKPTAVVIGEQTAKLKDLAGRLTSPNPDYVALSERLASVSQEMAGIRTGIKNSIERRLAPERRSLLRRRSEIEATGWRSLSDSDRDGLRRIYSTVDAGERLTLEQTIEAELAASGLPDSVKDYILGTGSAFRDPGRMFATSKRPAAEMRTKAREVAFAAKGIDDIDKRLTLIERDIRNSLADIGTPEANRQAELNVAFLDLQQKLLLYWSDPSLKTLEDHQVRLAMEALIEDMRDPVQFATRKRPQDYLATTLDRADGMWELQRGSLSPVNAGFANVMASTRNLISAASLGSAIISSLSDPAFGQDARLRFGMGLARANFGRVLVMTLQEMLTKGKREDAIRAGLGLDGALDVMHRKARENSTIDGRAWTGYAADRVLAPLSAYTQAGKHMIGLDMQAFLADVSGTSWGELGSQTQKALAAHGFDAGSWDLVRSADKHEPKQGVTYLRPREVEAVAGKALAERYVAMILRETRYAVPEATVASRSVLGRTRPGTTLGEVMRSAGQFKGFGISVAMLHAGRIAREIGSGDRTAMAHAATLLVTSAFLGAIAMALKDVNAGRDPRRWLDEKTYLDPAFWGAAFLQSGGLGIYGDFLFSNTGRHGQSLQSAVAGPVVDRLDNLLALTTGNMFQRMRGEKTNFGREATRFVRQNVPGANFIGLGLVFQRTVFDKLQRLADPEAQAAFNRQMQVRRKDYRQEFYWPPGESAPRRAPEMSRILATR